MSTLKVTNIQSNGAGFNDVVSFQNSAGTQNGTLCRAWVNLNGTSTVAIRGSFNVNNIIDGGLGTYTVNFSNELSDANYAITVGGGQALDANTNIRFTQGNSLTSKCVITTIASTTAAAKDIDTLCVSIFR